MRNFNVTVNGKTYQVEIEEVVGGAAIATPAPAAVTAPAPAPVSAPAPKASAIGGTAVNSPLPGLILQVTVNDGATVKKGDKIMVLEAMKMEHDIFAPAAGKISLVAKKGDKVETGATLATLS